MDTPEVKNDPSVKTFLSSEENARYEAFLKARGAKKGPYTRLLILRELAAAEKAEGGN